VIRHKRRLRYEHTAVGVANPFPSEWVIGLLVRRVIIDVVFEIPSSRRCASYNTYKINNNKVDIKNKIQIP
jgi:hypothetical protein